ncbi:hypothetical protein L0657_05025 [Dyadobacter sp. CY345]|uniref:hypothetical protein n=1 Tax=Dyadobacter sp. CY345 TaxID=2909335 RepID=UPI001F2C6EA4|nr:hypothetical protein [Dyadobacter sp. CY345]MCF2443311.1 hypothetical protein [Dyadobacter sp. CY345]
MLFLISAALVLLILLLSIMLAKKNKLFADWFLILYLSFTILSQVYLCIEHSGLLHASYWMLLGKGVYLLHAPIFYLYIVSLTGLKKLQLKDYFI